MCVCVCVFGKLKAKFYFENKAAHTHSRQSRGGVGGVGGGGGGGGGERQVAEC